MNGGSARSRLKRDHLPVRLPVAAADPPGDDSLSAIDVDIDHEALGVHLAAAREAAGLDRSRDVGLVECDHLAASADPSNHRPGCYPSWPLCEGRRLGASQLLKTVDRANRLSVRGHTGTCANLARICSGKLV